MLAPLNRYMSSLVPTAGSSLSSRPFKDADFFASEGDNAASGVNAGNDDLLGGGGDFTSAGQQDELSGFESSFPAIDTTNDVCGLAQL